MEAIQCAIKSETMWFAYEVFCVPIHRIGHFSLDHVDVAIDMELDYERTIPF